MAATLVDILSFNSFTEINRESIACKFRQILRAAKIGFLISRQSKLIQDNTEDFLYWGNHYYDKFYSNNYEYIDNLPAAIILSSIIALKFKLPRDAIDDVPLFSMERGQSLLITESNKVYFANLYHVYLEYVYMNLVNVADKKRNAFKYYYYIYILERSPFEVIICNQLPRFFNFLANETTIVSFEVGNVPAEVDWTDIRSKLMQYNSVDYNQKISSKHNFDNYTAYILYMFQQYNIKPSKLLSSFILTKKFAPALKMENLSTLSSLAYENYLLLQTKTLRSPPVARKYSIINKPSAYVKLFDTDVLKDNHNGIVNIAIGKILLQQHIAQYGLIYPINKVAILYSILDPYKPLIAPSDHSQIVLDAMLIKMGMDPALVHTLSSDYSIATILTGVAPRWLAQNVNYYSLKHASAVYGYNHGYSSDIKRQRHSFLQSNYLLYQHLFDINVINIEFIKNVLQSSSYTIGVNINTQGKYWLFQPVHRQIVYDFASFLPKLTNTAIMQAPLRNFTKKYSLLFFHRVDVSYINNVILYLSQVADILSNDRLTADLILDLPYIDFTLNNQQLCDKYAIANIYPRIYLLYLVMLIAKRADIYYRLNTYQLGDGKLYSVKKEKEITVTWYNDQIIAYLLRFTNANQLAVLSLLYALNLFEPDNLQKFNQQFQNKIMIE